MRYLIALACASSAAADYVVDWRVPQDNDANANAWVADVVVPAGEKVVLEWTDYFAFHNVYRAVPKHSTPSALRLGSMASLACERVSTQVSHEGQGGLRRLRLRGRRRARAQRRDGLGRHRRDGNHDVLRVRDRRRLPLRQRPEAVRHGRQSTRRSRSYFPWPSQRPRGQSAKWPPGHSSKGRRSMVWRKNWARSL